MTQYEVYVECSSRRANVARCFLDHFLPMRREVADEYPFPELSDEPLLTFSTAADLICRLESELSESYAVYWERMDDGEPFQAMLFFTEDGGMIAGLSASRSEPAELLLELANIVGGRYGVVVGEQRPPAIMESFVEMCRRAEGIRLVSGRLLTE